MTGMRSVHLCAAVAAAAGLVLPAVANAELMIVGNDQKVGGWDEAGKMIAAAPGEDTISIVDIGSDPANPQIVANLELMNSIFGPPTNLAIAPDEKLALATNAMNWVQEGDTWKPGPDNKLYVIDLEAEPPALLETLEVGQQPSGMAISPAGDLALIANRAGNSISVLAIDGKTVEHLGEVDMGGQVAAVAIAPDGKRALAAKFPEHKVSVLSIDGRNVTYDGQDIPVGLWPYNVAITPDGSLALTADNGASGASDGHVDTVSVIDLEADPPRVIDKVVVGDGPEGLAISPTGELAVAILLNGSAAVPKDAWFANPKGKVVVLALDGKEVSKVGEVDVGRLPEGVVFSKDGSHLYVGNYPDNDVSILKVDGATVTDTGQKLQLPGQPASMRGSHP
ncbi:MAG TPA: YncE family protein [Geminicoccaceae bacterium]|nr:YncE family protein [Geminicoccaceae bacterium]